MLKGDFGDSQIYLENRKYPRKIANKIQNSQIKSKFRKYPPSAQHRSPAARTNNSNPKQSLKAYFRFNRYCKP